MGDGWETRRRREPGNDWCVIELGAPGVVEKIEVDTRLFKGNYPGSLLHPGGLCHWRHRPLGDDAVDVLEHAAARAEVANGCGAYLRGASCPTRPGHHIRFNIFPDGGVSRLRLWGKVAK